MFSIQCEKEEDYTPFWTNVSNGDDIKQEVKTTTKIYYTCGNDTKQNHESSMEKAPHPGCFNSEGICYLVCKLTILDKFQLIPLNGAIIYHRILNYIC